MLLYLLQSLLFFPSFLIVGVPIFAEDLPSPPSDPYLESIKKKLEARGFSQCKANNGIVCQVSPDWKPRAEEIKARDQILKNYTAYKGGEVPIGTFGAVRVLGEHSYDEYHILPDKNAVLKIYRDPKLSSEPTFILSGDDSNSRWDRFNSRWDLEGIRAAYNTFLPDIYFYDVKNGFLKIKYRTEGAQTSNWGWMRVPDVDRVKGINDLAGLITGISPGIISGIYDEPGRKKGSLGQFEPGRIYSIGVSETRIHGGVIWLKISAEVGSGCADGTEDTNPNWVGKWFIYQTPDQVEFYAPC